MVSNIRTIKAVSYYIINGCSPLSYKIQHVNRFIYMYRIHTTNKQIQMQRQLLKYKQIHTNPSYIANIKDNIYNLPNNFNKKVVHYKHKLLKIHQSTNYENQSKKLFKKFFSFMSLYYEALQSMVEGRREVLHNPDFKFQDGQTAQDKTYKFQQFFQQILGKKTQ